MEVVADLVGMWRSISERLIFQSISKNFPFQPKEKLKREMWGSLKVDGGAPPNNEWGQYCYGRRKRVRLL